MDNPDSKPYPCAQMQQDLFQRLKERIDKLNKKTDGLADKTEGQNSKFIHDFDDGQKEMQFGALKEYWEGLDGYLGLPHTKVFC